MPTTADDPGKGRELIMFFVLAVMIWPVIACAFVGAYGLAFWCYFILAGPPGTG